MPELIVELFSEEIPARMQAKAETGFATAVTKGLAKFGLSGGSVAQMSGPRRLCVIIDDLPARSKDKVEERKGPKTTAPEQAVSGFMKAAGLTDISQAEIRQDPKKGDYYVAVQSQPGQETSAILAELLPDIIRNFHWPKSMRTGRGSLRWVRPLQRILCLFDGDVVAFEIDGITSGNVTEGHRVHGRGPYEIANAADYVEQLSGAGHVLLNREDRRNRIVEGAAAVCAPKGVEWVEDAGLLEEVIGLAEYPHVIIGDMEPSFLSLPSEVVQLSMRTHQKYFAVRDKATGDLAPNFIVVANIEAADGGAKIAAGNAKVLSARLEDARFFWDNDRRVGLDAMATKLAGIDFKKGLGSIADKVERVADLARKIAPMIGADAELAERAARLAKADLVSEMVYEFPELQGIMGRYYAIEAGENAQVAEAIAQHYRPQGPSEPVPSESVSIAVALADKIDTLAGFWALGEKPTGSKDPFALRRAALGVVRILLENNVRISLKSVLDMARMTVGDQQTDIDDLLAFFGDRLKQYLRDAGMRHDLIDAVFGRGDDDLVSIVKRVEALNLFLDNEDGQNLLAGYKRAANILKAEEKKDGCTYRGTPEPRLFEADEEAELYAALTVANDAASEALAADDFTSAMAALSCLRTPLDNFFEAIIVNSDHSDVRHNRLLMLVAIRDGLHGVANFSLIAG